MEKIIAMLAPVIAGLGKIFGFFSKLVSIFHKSPSQGTEKEQSKRNEQLDKDVEAAQKRSRKPKTPKGLIAILIVFCACACDLPQRPWDKDIFYFDYAGQMCLNLKDHSGNKDMPASKCDGFLMQSKEVYREIDNTITRVTRERDECLSSKVATPVE